MGEHNLSYSLTHSLFLIHVAYKPNSDLFSLNPTALSLTVGLAFNLDIIRVRMSMSRINNFDVDYCRYKIYKMNELVVQ